MKQTNQVVFTCDKCGKQVVADYPQLKFGDGLCEATYTQHTLSENPIIVDYYEDIELVDHEEIPHEIVSIQVPTFSHTVNPALLDGTFPVVYEYEFERKHLCRDCQYIISEYTKVMDDFIKWKEKHEL